MLDAVRKKLFNTPKEETMETKDLQPELSADLAAQLSAATEALAAKDVEMVGLAEKLAELTASLESATAALATLEDAKAAMIADAKAVKFAARKEKVVAAVGTAKADPLMAATETLDDAAFEAVMGALSASADTESNSKMFQEKGVTVEVVASQVTEESAEMKMLKKKYGAK